MANKKHKLSFDEVRKITYNFYQKQLNFKEAQSKFNKLKAQFNSDMEDYFEHENIDKSMLFLSDEFDEQALKVNRVQKSSIEFNEDKLEKALGKELSKQVITKKYEITDIDALINYLKGCNVDPKVFKSFLNVSKLVDENELDKLEELGKIDLKQIEGCYTVKKYKPYFTVGVKRGNGDGEQKW